MPFYIYPDSRETVVYIYNQPVKLMPNDFKLVKYIYDNRRKDCSYEELIKYIWSGLQGAGRDKGGIEQILFRVRTAFKDACGFGFIETITGFGIRLMI
jgi:DNA-binding winged helix-turn-helix (wHTH) protein